MGIRTRGFVVDYYIPLFAGVDAAKRARGRLTFPPDLYHPGDDDGDIETPEIDLTIMTPEITFPSLLEAVVQDDDSATCTAFESDVDQTHAASRWLIEVAVLDEGEPTAQSTGMILYDSGATTTNLTSLPLASVGMQPETAYIISVRHKGSNGGWSDWSLPVVFEFAACSIVPDDIEGLVLWFDGSDSSAFTEVSGRVSQWDDKSVSVSNAVQGTALSRPIRKFDKFSAGAVEIVGSEGMTFASTALSPGTVFMVVDWIAATTVSAVAMSQSDIASDDYVGLRSINLAPPVNGTMLIDNQLGSRRDSNDTAIPSGQYILEFVIGTPGTSSLLINGVVKASSSIGVGWTLTATRFGLQSTYVGNGNQIAEILVYNSVLSSDDRTALRSALADKWNIS